MLRVIKRRKRAVASVGMITAAAVALGIVAFAHPGFTTTDVEMHDGGVWVTNLETSQIGHLNYQAGELDSGLVASSENFDVVQNNGTVLAVDQTNASINPIDTGQASFRGDIPLPGVASVTVRGGTVTVLSEEDGRLWAADVDAIASLDFEEQDPLAVLGPGSAATADESGNVHAASAEHGNTYLWEREDGGFLPQAEVLREELRGASELSITTVGQRAVILDAADGELVLPDAVVKVSGDAVLQHPGADAAEVILATGEGLVWQPLGGGEPRAEQFAGGGSAVAPVRVDSCVHAAWPGDARVVRLCEDKSANLDELVDVPMSGDVLFREHRGVVALNDVRSGIAWLMSDELIMVDNWADLIPPVTEEETEELDEESMDDSVDNVAPDPSEENNDPVANDDTIFGARTGRSTLVSVLHNDTDQDGDILTVSLVGEAPAGVRISPVKNSSQFQVEIPADYRSNSVNFRYEVNDGRGGTDQATVTLAIRGENDNAAPEELRPQSFEVEQRADYEHSVFDSWFDPDGDDLFLVDAYSDSGDTVRYNPNGRIIYTATGEPGPTTMTIVVSDGLVEQEGTINVDVRERGTSTPIANADYVSIGAGQSVAVKPLANDFLPAGENARLASATARGDVAVEIDRATNTLHITGSNVGTHFVDYTVASGANQAQGHIRVDIIEPIDDAQPVAVRDVALLPMGGEALVDLTDNDVDPTGGVLVVQSIETGGAPLDVQLKQRHMLRIEDRHGLTDRTTLQYQISNGENTAVGEVVIVPVAPPENPRNPVAVDDTVTLREGDYVSVPVTDNDFSPDNFPFQVNPELVESSLPPEYGSVFVDGDQIRVHVEVGGPSSVDVTYEVFDDFGNTDTASLRVEVEPRDSETNSPPLARDVTARVLAGNEVRIPIPLNGIDPDGDGVVLVGWETAPDMGRVTQVGPDFIDFEAFRGDSGTTTFQYRVRDRWGAEAISSITVGIAQPNAVNQPPHAALDTVFVRPDRAVAVSVLDNDSDPDGDELSLTSVNTEDAPEEFKELGLGSKTPTVNFIAPSEPGEYTLEYTITDARGASAIGAVSVRVAEDAPLLPPTAVDDVVEVADLVLAEPFVVPALENDRDPDGDPAALALEILTGEGEVVPEGIQVIPAEDFQVLTYRVTDQDGGQASAFIFVPGVGEQLPYIASSTKLYIGSGQPLEIELAQYVEMPAGGKPRITTEETVSATNSNDDPLVVDQFNLVYTSEPGYVGEAAISFEVTDDAQADDPDRLSARLTIPIEVTPSSEVPPEFNGAEVQVQPGEAATVYDLKLATWDPDDGDIDGMKYDYVGGEVDGVNVQVDGQSFVASADPSAPTGTRGNYEIRLTDPAGNEVSGMVIVEVVESTRPMPRAATDTGETDQGVEFTTNVIQNDFNPFQNLGEPLNVRDVRVVRGEVQSAPTTDGTNVSVTPRQDFSGILTLQYTIEDATQSDNRTAVGNVEISVRGRPDAPLRPNINAIGDSEVSLAWAAPASNGAPITGYIVQWNGGSQDCPSTSCTVTGLTNDTVYNFQVIAVNDVGESDASPTSIDARPDVRPERPNPPQATRGDKELAITWEQPVNRGSAIEFYYLQISPAAPDGTSQVRVESTNYNWKGLRNGVEYTFVLQAHNNADEPSEWSRSSRGVIPAGPPSAPGTVEASPNQLGGTVNQVNVSWGAADGNGISVDSYTVTPYRGGTALNDYARTVPATANSETVSTTFESLPVSEQAYTFVVFATNDVSDGESARSEPTRLVNPPESPSATVVTNHNGATTINVQAGGSNGYSANEITYQYQVGGGSWQTMGKGNAGLGQQRITAPNGQQSVQVRAVGVTSDGVRGESSPRGVSGVHPYGPIGKPSVSAEPRAGGVDVSWSAPSANGHPVTVTAEYRIGNGGWQRVNSPQTISASGGQEVTIRVEATTGKPNNDNGAQTTSNQTSARSLEPSITLTRGDAHDPGNCSGQNGAGCRYYVLNWKDFPSGTYNFQCFNTGSENDTNSFQSGSITINSRDGSAWTGNRRSDGTSHLCYSGYSGQAWMRVYGNGVDLLTPRVSWPS